MQKELGKLFNDELKEDSVFGAFPCEITGRQDEDDPMYIEVVLPNEKTQFVRACYSFPLFSTPSESWLEEYKDSLYGWVTFERGMPEYPILIGFTFKEGKEHDIPSFPNGTYLLGGKYHILIDDENNTLELNQIKGNEQSIKITEDSVQIISENINLGESEGKESSVLGDTLEKLLEDLIDILSTGKVATLMGPQLFMPDTQAKLTQMKTTIKNIKSDINKLS